MGHRESSVGKDCFLSKNILPLTEGSLVFVFFLGTGLDQWTQAEIGLKLPGYGHLRPCITHRGRLYYI